MKIYLASKSPRRRELLGKITDGFEIIDVNADESVDEILSPQERIAAISVKKSQAARKTVNDGDIVITADTAVFSDGLQLGKPKSKEDAFNMLSMLSGKKHSVITAVTVSNGQKTVTRAVTTTVNFRPISKSEITAYIESGEPMDKAGAYGIQGGASRFITGIEGDYFSVVGLPVCELTLILKDFGVVAD